MRFVRDAGEGGAPRIRTGRLFALLLVLVVALTACGGGTTGSGGDDEASTPETEATTDSAEGETTDAAEPAEQTTVRVGYLHTLAVDGIMWTGLENGFFEDRGVTLELTQFDSGISLSQALAGGSIDLAIMGAVISNFPAQGQGYAVLANNIESDTAQIWAKPDSGIEAVADLAGKTIATVQGTTAHVLLHIAHKDAGVDESQIEIANSDMATAVNAFLSGSVPALVTWAPNDVAVRERMPDAKLITTAGDYYPDAAILGGWVASNDFYANHKDAIKQVALAWLDSNEELMSNTDAALEAVWESAYKENIEDPETLKQMFEQIRSFTNEEWLELYEDGSVQEWLGQVEQIFVEIGGLDTFVEPSEFFDGSIFVEAYEEWAQ